MRRNLVSVLLMVVAGIVLAVLGWNLYDVRYQWDENWDSIAVWVLAAMLLGFSVLTHKKK